MSLYWKTGILAEWTLIRLAQLISAGAILAGLLVAPAAASNHSAKKTVPVKAVVELFTSQGCSSCPPADRLLATYVRRKDVIALTLPVDIWDYLGWRDTLANHKFTERQRSYARAQRSQVYTPQVIISGMTHAVGSDKAAIDQAINLTARKLAARQIVMHMWTEGSKLVIDVAGAVGGTDIKEATIWIAVVKRSIKVAIRRGENDGRTVTYHNVVREMMPVGMWSGKPVKVVLAKHAVMRSGAEICIALLQLGSTGPIIGAAEVSGW